MKLTKKQEQEIFNCHPGLWYEVKRFNCPKCKWLSPAGYQVNEADCPLCKTPMTKGYYKQYKNHCTLIEEVQNVD